MNSSIFDFDRHQTAKRLKMNKSFKPCPTEEGDEIFQNGIFKFNISKLIEYIKDNPDEFELIEVAVDDFPKSFLSVNEKYVEFADIFRPVIIAEISPGHYNLIDGNHRMEKARKIGQVHMKAFRVNVNQHIEFLTEKDAYFKYVGYWNSKAAH